MQNPLTDKIGWTKISGSFVAQGGEKYIVIGNFKDDAHSDTVFVNSALPTTYDWDASYYYIDDVIVSPDSTYADSLFAGVNEVNLQTKNAKVYPNPANTVLHVDIQQWQSSSASSFCLYNATGQRVKCVTFNTDNNTLAIGTLPTGLYYYRLKDNTGKILKTGKLTIVH